MSHEKVVDGVPLGRPPGCPFDPPAALSELRDEAPVVRMKFPDGHLGWLVTGYPEVRAVAADQRFSNRYELSHFPLPGMEHVEQLPPAPVGDLTGIDAPEHTRFRKLLTGKFTVRRMRLLSDRVAEVAAEHLDAMEAAGPGVDLVEAYAHPVPAVMICELLGVPYADRESFQANSAAISDVDLPETDRMNAYGALQEYVGELVLTKRASPTDDLLSDLTGSDLTDEELAGLGTFLLAAGLDTTANMIALGTYALLSHPAQLAVVRDDPAAAGGAVEELMRYLSIAHTGVRAALEDVEVGGEVIRAGESVVVSVLGANRDPRRFPRPDELDVRRDAVGHVAFGHGVHQCLGQQLARVEMTVALPELLRRFPGLRVDGEVVLRSELQNIYGVRRLPVAW
ncbi:cytochrome P450 [Amycolatopsis benzoatilytica]|uniref:cytochrome P450 n=1 Tax=Amycolatopsis benzoatilytica TaxID=346045 RepID=UPI00037378B0|nr:cytochrome P450 [Amycolatopsis benzoatilytica]